MRGPSSSSTALAEVAAASSAASGWRGATTQMAAVAIALLFIAVAKELPVTLMLMPPGQQTLAYRVFDAQSEASLPDVALAGLLLLAMVVLVQTGLNRWRRYVR